MGTFKDLLAWQKSLTLAKKVYQVTGNFPTEERFGLVNQMRRCAVSIPSNIAEGYGRGSDKELLRFLYVALGSSNELETQLILSLELSFMKEEDYILRKVGTENSFRVPEGYFEGLTSDIMNKLPEKEKPAFVQKEPTMWDKVKPWLYMAAMFAGAALIIRVASADRQPASNADYVAAEETDKEMQYINEVVDNSMLDDYSLYVYLSDMEAE